MMMNTLLNKGRTGEAYSLYKRSDRLEKHLGYWYFKTREGHTVGPFYRKYEAKYALNFFIHSAQWPDKQQLTDFIEGCEYNQGIFTA